jgi:pimeloyl-ACP methyl ester carboxylesterase
MASIRINGVELWYEDTGGSGSPILFSHGLLLSARQFDPQVTVLRDSYRCIAYDHRGQGRSAPSKLRSIDIETLTADAIALIEALGLAPVHFCGHSMGGFIGMRLAARHPELIRSLMLLDTSADPEPPENVPRFRRMSWIARYLGTWLVIDPTMKLMFGHTALADPARAAERRAWRLALQANRRTIWRAVNGVIERRGIANELSTIKVPTLILVGEEDLAAIPAEAQAIHEAIYGSRLVTIPAAGHITTWEQPLAVNVALAAFLAEQLRCQGIFRRSP